MKFLSLKFLKFVSMNCSKLSTSLEFFFSIKIECCCGLNFNFTNYDVVFELSLVICHRIFHMTRIRRNICFNFFFSFFLISINLQLERIKSSNELRLDFLKSLRYWKIFSVRTTEASRFKIRNQPSSMKPTLTR